jgi:hypothetical protein
LEVTRREGSQQRLRFHNRKRGVASTH